MLVSHCLISSWKGAMRVVRLGALVAKASETGTADGLQAFVGSARAKLSPESSSLQPSSPAPLFGVSRCPAVSQLSTR